MGRCDLDATLTNDNGQLSHVLHSGVTFMGLLRVYIAVYGTQVALKLDQSGALVTAALSRTYFNSCHATLVSKVA